MLTDPVLPLAAALTFGEPSWWWALLLAPVLLALYFRARRYSAAAIAQVLSPRLRTLLAESIPATRRHLRFGLLLLAFVSFVAALARPQYGFDGREIKRKGLDVIIAVDTSKSMLATDIEPNRLTRAKLAAQDLMALCRGDRLGVIAFAGRAFLMAPLTIDYGAVINAIRELDTEVIPRGGTNLSEALQLAVEAFGKGEGADKVLVFLTDGEDLEADALVQARKAADAGVKIYCVGIGSTEGSLIPLPGGQFIRDRGGQLVRTRLDEGKLREVAQSGSGYYVRLDSSTTAMETMYRDHISKLRAGESESKTTQRPIERFIWPLAVGVLALVAALFVPQRRRAAAPAPGALRRKATPAVALLLALLVPASEILAATGREAMKQLQQGKFAEAEESFSALTRQAPESPRLQYNLGSAAYQRKEYRRAAEAFGRALAAAPDDGLRSRSHYNLGNSLFRQGETQKDNKARIRDWQDALKHYDATLHLDPANADAKANRELVARLLEQAKQAQKQKGKSKDKQKQDQGEDQEDGEDGEDGEPQKDGQKQKKKKKKKDDQKQDGQEQQQGEDGDDEDGEQDRPTNERQDEEGNAPPDEKERQERRDRAARNAPETEDQSKQGELQARNGGQKEGKENPQVAEARESDPAQKGKLSAGQARRLLEALKGEDDRVILTDRPRRTEPVFKDW
ncbi:MAG: VWA domain-containing protein [Verrucomicrobia bacterium]|nr:VWA domain-containing protein [Verrucomicrobiota bacterium]